MSVGWFKQPDGSKLNTSTSDTGVLANFFNSLLVRKNAGPAVGPDGKPAGNYDVPYTVCAVLFVGHECDISKHTALSSFENHTVF